MPGCPQSLFFPDFRGLAASLFATSLRSSQFRTGALGTREFLPLPSAVQTGSSGRRAAPSALMKPEEPQREACMQMPSARTASPPRSAVPRASPPSDAQPADSPQASWPAPGFLQLSSPRLMWHRGTLSLLCSSCRYVVRKWHVPILGVDCNANPRHKQALSVPVPRSRGIPKHLYPFLYGKQYPRHPCWRQAFTHRSRMGKYKPQVARNG